MNEVYEYETIVRDEDIDENGHANNVVYVRWMQEAAIAHSAAMGWDTAKYQSTRMGWFIKSHQIDYLQPCFEGQEIIVQTWIKDMKSVSSTRGYAIYRKRDSVLLAKASTRWAFMNMETKEITQIIKPIREKFLVLKDEMPAPPTISTD